MGAFQASEVLDQVIQSEDHLARFCGLFLEQGVLPGESLGVRLLLHAGTTTPSVVVGLPGSVSQLTPNSVDPSYLDQHESDLLQARVELFETPRAKSPLASDLNLILLAQLELLGGENGILEIFGEQALVLAKPHNILWDMTRAIFHIIKR